MKSFPCNIVLLPNEQLADRAIAASRRLASQDSFFTLQTGEYYPHLSLYMCQLNEAGISQVKEVLAGIAREFHVVPGAARRYYLGEGYGAGYVDAEYEVTEELRAFQDTVVAQVNPLRSGMREKDIAKMQDATGIMLQNLQQYGYPVIGPLFRPHITLTRLKSYQPEVLQMLPNVDDFNGVFNRIGLFEMGDNGTCVREISSFDLQP